ncbi:MAG: DUF86 domain-containing protein [Deltaproteobacteria bacterium]|nr:DUF86 domain-containing protein [Deltaproteobacteria bacterium]
MVDRLLIQRKILLLDEKKAALKSFALKTYKEFLKGPYPKAVEKLLQEMVEICLDIGKHLIADEGWEFANESRDIFQRLAEKKVISKKCLKTMLKMVGFRNLVVHLYEQIDSKIVYKIYQRHLGDFANFAKKIFHYLQK